jgi:hypothetical protein
LLGGYLRYRALSLASEIAQQCRNELLVQERTVTRAARPAGGIATDENRALADDLERQRALRISFEVVGGLAEAVRLSL